MKTQITLIGIMLLLFSILVGAQHTENDSADARQLIEQKVPCSQLSEEQLEHIGDYIMEQMHPGEAHKVMDQMMGGEGSESLRAAHINMARHFYCRKGVVTDMGMMNTGGMMNMGMMNMGGMSSMPADSSMSSMPASSGTSTTTMTPAGSSSSSMSMPMM